jgi:hypothetical protein
MSEWPDRFVIRNEHLFLGSPGSEITPVVALERIADRQRSVIASVRSLGLLVLGLVLALAYLAFIWIDLWSPIGLVIGGATIAVGAAVVIATLLLQWGFRRAVPEDLLQDAWNDGDIEARWNQPTRPQAGR